MLLFEIVKNYYLYKVDEYIKNFSDLVCFRLETNKNKNYNNIFITT